jgi:hypothetical protein
MNVEAPYAAIDVLVEKLTELDDGDDIALNPSVAEALAKVRTWLDACPNVQAARKFKLQMRHAAEEISELLHRFRFFPCRSTERPTTIAQSDSSSRTVP